MTTKFDQSVAHAGDTLILKIAGGCRPVAIKVSTLRFKFKDEQTVEPKIQLKLRIYSRISRLKMISYSTGLYE